MGRIVKRTRQLFRAMFSKMDPEDCHFIDKYLNETEKRLFYNMDSSIQKHCVNVARTAIDICRNNDLDNKLLIRSSLLHDIGKPMGSFNIAHRVLYVLVNRIFPKLTGLLAYPAQKGLFHHLRYAFFIHLNHAKTGAEIARKCGLSGELVFLIANHHNKSLAHNSKELSVLIKADEIN